MTGARKRGKTRGVGMIIRFPRGRESDSLWGCLRLPTSMALALLIVEGLGHAGEPEGDETFVGVVDEHMPPFRQRLRSRRIGAGPREHLALRRRVVQILRYGPGDADHRGAANVLPDRGAADPDRSGDHPLAR